MANQKIAVCLSVILCLCYACGSGPQRPNVPYVENSPARYGRDVVVPFHETDGVRTIQVKINDCSEFPFIYDTGCSSGMLLSVAEVYVLAKQGCIIADDIEGYQLSTIADGSIVQNMVINLREIRIGNLVCRNVKASVSNVENAPLLLGNEALSQEVSSIIIDDENKLLKFCLK